MNLSDICDNGKVILALCIAEMILKSINVRNEDYDYCRKSVDLCWDWLNNKKISKEQICERMSNDDDNSISDIVINTEDVDLANKYGAVLICVSYIGWQAYNYDEVYFYPQDLESVDDEYLEELINELIEEKFIVCSAYEDSLTYIKNNYNQTNNDTIKQEVMNIFKRK